MDVKRLTTWIAAATIGLLLPLAVVTRASAETEVRHDAVGDANGGGDIKKLVVRHQTKRVVIKVVYADRADPEEMWLRVDRPKAEKWDYWMGTGAYYPRWYSIWERREFDGDPKCSFTKRTTTRHTIRMVVPRRCFDNAPKIRVRVLESDNDLQDDNPASHDRTRWTAYAHRN